MLAFSIAPSVSDDDGHVTAAVAEAVAIVRRSGLEHRTDAMFTTIEGEWAECMAVVEACVAAMSQRSPRVSLVMKADIRPGVTGELSGKLDRLEAELAR